MGLDNHRFALASPTRPSATSKKSFSNVSWPILACMSFVLGPCSPPRFSAGDRNTPIAPSSNCVFHCVIWLPCTSYFSTSSASVLSPFNAARATFALNAAVWFRLGLLIALLLCGRYPRPFEQVLHLNASLIFPSQLCSCARESALSHPNTLKVRVTLSRFAMQNFWRLPIAIC